MQGWTDIRWDLMARLPAPARPYANLMRLDRPIGVWLLLLPGWWGIALAAHSLGQALWLGFLFAVGATIMRGAGCVVNDLWDRELDRQVERTRGRPLASGEVSVMQALVFLAVLGLIGLAILTQLNWLSIWLGVASLGPVVVYPLAKRVTDYPQAVLGVTFGWGATLGYAAAAGTYGWAPFLLHAAAFFWILGYDTIYAHQDREDDAQVGIRSTARRFEHTTRPFLIVCYSMVMLLLCLAGWAGGLSWLYAPALIPAALLLGWQVVRVDIDNPALCLALFKLNRDVGLLITLAVLIGRL
ncbi:4-hydroxybenzoate octaprenyltransferase [Rhodovarius crocodyli]|uniref:4-hydroxybenzoate octaprenyltransferase n=1 Tax=Rhodovarius crocodyli TaxID=1979269 RepID=A0A437ME24_9PROT|nr:4-hydroxybenzoate octaprenyltransferase [Rhodovarius crocodyli]RVT95923.1 4-hydroxybenzoate octaprenyltransferase [Rhodovarius crocodyli]